MRASNTEGFHLRVGFVADFQPKGLKQKYVFLSLTSIQVRIRNESLATFASGCVV